MFWQLMVDLSRQDKVTVFISTHFMNEAERCDRISLMHAGKVLASGTPQELVEKRGAASLEEAFIAYLQEAAGQSNEAEAPPVVHDTTHAPRQGFSLRRLFSYSRREALELRRDPVRSTLALMGTVILMLIMGYGISMDVENLRFAVLDRDQTVSSQAWTLNLSGSRYFIEQPPLTSYDELDRRMRAGDITVAIEIRPAQFRARYRAWYACGTRRLDRRSDAQSCRNGKRLRAGNAPELASGCGEPTIDTRQPKRADEH